MTKDYLAILIVASLSVLMLLLFVRRDQIRRALVALLVAQLFSWPLTLTYVLLGLQVNPVRLFPHATESNFLFAFIFHPSVFTVYYLHYPRQAKLFNRVAFSLVMPALPLLVQFLSSMYTDLIYYPFKLLLPVSFLLILVLYYISRRYIDWYFDKSFRFWRAD